VLSRMATGQHRKLSLSSNDVIVLSSTPIPGNEKAVSKVINELSRRRTMVIYQDTHVSGHACAEELKLIYSLVHPKFAIPVHGELRHRLAQKDVALAIGVPKENCILVDTGDVIELSKESCRVVDKVQAGPVMVDGLGIGDVGNAVLKDRQSLSQNGILIVAFAINKSTGELLSGPEIVTRGLIYVKENEAFIEEVRAVVLKVIDESRKYKDIARIRNVLKNQLSDYIWRKMNRTPMILPVISEV
ncbi:MAG: ribonuclease J, partial [Eubacteriales bacterium]|nr:ribonuclease J [Eubacteriales bacterium]